MENNDTVAVVVHAAHPEGGGLFSVDPGLAVWTWVVFGLLLVVLRRYAWGPMMQTIRERERMMADTVEKARKTSEELAQIGKRQQEMLAATEEQARAIVESGRRAAETAARAIAERAAQEAEVSLERAKEQIHRERERAVEEFGTRAVDLVITASEKLLAEGLNDDAHRRVVERQLEAL